jgi:uncharacterized surface protein with fasciclin (FAS1) repeats
MKKFATLILIGAMACGFTLAGTCGSQKADLVDTAVSAGSFETLVAAVQAAGLVDALKADGPLTVFAPTDEAFAKLPAGTVETLLRPENKGQLIAILTYHVAPGSLTADRVVSADRIETLNGQRPAVSVADGQVRVGVARVTKTDIMASNGVIHVIDQVLIPSDEEMVERRASAAPAERLIRMAIDRGVPLFNNNQPEACTAIYEVAAQGLLSSEDFGLNDHARETLRTAMTRTRQTHDARRQAWIMRHALDEVMASLDEMGTMSAMSLR